MEYDALICRRCKCEDKEFRPTRRVCRDCEREDARRRSFKYTRGITYEERDRIFERQGKVCAACGTNKAGSSKGWHVDHCHETERIRGVLCASCNIALGQVNDSTERLEKLIDYLNS